MGAITISQKSGNETGARQLDLGPWDMDGQGINDKSSIN